MFSRGQIFEVPSELNKADGPIWKLVQHG